MIEATAPIHFIVPGPIDQRTGGYGYDRRIVDELRAQGRTVRVVELDGEFPFCCAVAKKSATDALREMPDGAVAVIDVLALPGFGRALPRQTGQVTVVALVHHPLALETGLSAADSGRLGAIERDLLSRVDAVVTTSPATARMLANFGVPEGALNVVTPGTSPATRARGSGAAGVRLLCVGALIDRKGHRMLIDALAECATLPWSLRCVGADWRDPALTSALLQRVASLGLADRIELAGEIGEADLATAYSNADIFVLASELEGYGMAFAEALACGLPIVGSGDGAVRDTVPERAGIIVPVGDRPALTAALSRAIEDGTLRRSLADGAWAAGQTLPDWPSAGREFAAVLERVAAGPR